MLKLHGSAQARIGRDILEHGVRQACASLLRQGLERGVNPMLLRHGQAAEPSLQRLMDFTVFAAASTPDSFDPREHCACLWNHGALSQDEECFSVHLCL